MSEALTLLVTDGPMRGRRFTFLQATRCVFGRAPDCFPRFPDTEEFETVSRRHCLVTVDPPTARIRDLGSLNGTFVNGREIGRRPEADPPPTKGPKNGPEVELKDGDEIRIGRVVLQLRRATRRLAQVKNADCAACSAPLVHQAKGYRLDGFLCRECQKKPADIVSALLKEADRGNRRLERFRNLELGRELGRGAAGAAYLVTQKETGREMAFKILLPEVALRKSARLAFLREVEISAALNHKNVVNLFHSGSFLGVFFYTMEYCRLGSLNELIYKHAGKVPLDEVLPLILQTLDGLEYIHQAPLPPIKLPDGTVKKRTGLVHRDLKPANIFLDRDEGGLVAKIADVGVGKAFDTAGLSGMTRTGTIAGSPVTMPRQQVINFKFAKPEVDVWAVAATFYILLTGKWPRNFRPDKDPVQTVLSEPAVPILQRLPDLPPRLAEVIDRALVDNPEIHFKSAAELKQAIKSALG